MLYLRIEQTLHRVPNMPLQYRQRQSANCQLERQSFSTHLRLSARVYRSALLAKNDATNTMLTATCLSISGSRIWCQEIGRGECFVETACAMETRHGFECDPGSERVTVLTGDGFLRKTDKLLFHRQIPWTRSPSRLSVFSSGSL